LERVASGLHAGRLVLGAAFSIFTYSLFMCMSLSEEPAFCHAFHARLCTLKPPYRQIPAPSNAVNQSLGQTFADIQLLPYPTPIHLLLPDIREKIIATPSKATRWLGRRWVLRVRCCSRRSATPTSKVIVLGNLWSSPAAWTLWLCVRRHSRSWRLARRG
jgi:hypothetical protein